MLNIENKKITIIGGGKVALRKTKKLLQFNKNITVISPYFHEQFKNIKNINLIKKKYKEEHIKGSFLVFGATSDHSINKKIAEDCKKNDILCNIVDSKELSEFIIPSSIKRGDLTISVSTMGKSPSLCKKIRKDLEKKYTDEYDEYIKLLGDIRELVLKKCDDKIKRREILNEIINLNIEDLKKRREIYENSSRI